MSYSHANNTSNINFIHIYRFYITIAISPSTNNGVLFKQPHTDTERSHPQMHKNNKVTKRKSL